jgi:hypothetical protein
MKWIGATVASACLVAALAAWSLSPTPNVTAAPALPPTDQGVIWIYHPKTDNSATLTAYTPKGRKVDQFTVRDDCYMGLTPDGQRIAFAGKNGKVAESRDAAGLTVHLRDIGDETEVTDTGIPADERYSYLVWSWDMKQVIYTRVKGKVGVFERYKFVLIDLATRVETPLNLPDDTRWLVWSRDGKWLLVSPSSNVWQRYTIADGKLQTLVANQRYFYMDLSPDGKKLIGYGPTREGVVGGPLPPYAVNRFDVATGAMTTGDKWSRKPNDMLAMSKWSLDGKRVAHAVRGRAPEDGSGEESYRIVVSDPDGGNEDTLVDTSGQFMDFIHWLPSPQRGVGSRGK